MIFRKPSGHKSVISQGLVYVIYQTQIAQSFPWSVENQFEQAFPKIF